MLDILDDAERAHPSMCTSVKRVGAAAFVESFLSERYQSPLHVPANSSERLEAFAGILSPIPCIQHPHQIPLEFLNSTSRRVGQEELISSMYGVPAKAIFPSLLCESERFVEDNVLLRGPPSMILDTLGTVIRLNGLLIEILDASSQSIYPVLSHFTTRLLTIREGQPQLVVTEWYHGNLRSVREFGNATADSFIQFYTQSQDIYSPDALIVSRDAVASCDVLRGLNLIHSFIKIIIFPIDSIVPPPIVSRPRHGLCSLSALTQILGSLYELVVVRPDGFAVFTHKTIAHLVPVKLRPPTDNVFDIWKSGIACNPRSTLFGLGHLTMTEFDILVSKEVGPDAKARLLRIYNFTIVSESYGSDLDYLYQPSELSPSMKLAQARRRAHCYQNLCDCSPPYRGYLCRNRIQDVDDIVLNYLTTNSSDDIDDLGLSLESFQESFPDTKHPIVIFYDSFISTRLRISLVKRVPRLHLWFVNQFFNEHPEISNPPLHYRPVGYRHMCRFESGAMFLHPAVLGYDFMVRLDTDNYFPKITQGDPFSAIKNPNGPALLYSDITVTYGNVLNGLLEVVALYVGSNSALDRLLTSGMKLLQISSPPFLFKASFFRSKAYMDFFKFIDAVGFYENGFLGNTVLTLGSFLFGGIGRVDIPAAHDGSCKCGPDDSEFHCEKHPVTNSRWIRNQSEKWICV